MAGIDEVLERLVTDQQSRSALAQNPKAALEGYDLSDDGRDLLAAQLSSDAGETGTVEQRTSKSALMAMDATDLTGPHRSERCRGGRTALSRGVRRGGLLGSPIAGE